MSSGPVRRSVGVAAIQARVLMANNDLGYPSPRAADAMSDIRFARGQFTQSVVTAMDSSGVDYDIGRVIAALDYMEQAVNLLQQALKLPAALAALPAATTTGGGEKKTA